jgi:dephospho-CoA kinase
MQKRIFIVNGMARAGKDTFAEFLKKMVPGVVKISSVDGIKEIASYLGWTGEKTEKDRKFLSDLKCLLSEYSDAPFRYIMNTVVAFHRDERISDIISRKRTPNSILLIDIREPAEIERAKIALNAKTIFIENNRVEQVTSNMADAGVYDYEYDITIRNNGTLEEFEEHIKEFVRVELGVEPIKADKAVV